jgi:hypothetical protein
MMRGKFPQYSADPGLPFFLWLRLEIGQKLVDVHLPPGNQDARRGAGGFIVL